MLVLIAFFYKDEKDNKSIFIMFLKIIFVRYINIDENFIKSWASPTQGRIFSNRWTVTNTPVSGRDTVANTTTTNTPVSTGGTVPNTTTIHRPVPTGGTVGDATNVNRPVSTAGSTTFVNTHVSAEGILSSSTSTVTGAVASAQTGVPNRTAFTTPVQNRGMLQGPDNSPMTCHARRLCIYDRNVNFDDTHNTFNIQTAVGFHPWLNPTEFNPNRVNRHFPRYYKLLSRVLEFNVTVNPTLEGSTSVPYLSAQDKKIFTEICRHRDPSALPRNTPEIREYIREQLWQR